MMGVQPITPLKADTLSANSLGSILFGSVGRFNSCSIVSQSSQSLQSKIILQNVEPQVQIYPE